MAVTDNVFAAPNDSDRESDVFFQVRPGAIWSYNARRMIHDLNAEAEVIHYAFHSRQPSLSGRGAWRGFWIPGPRSELITSAGGGTGVLTSLSSRLTPDQSMVNVQPLGKVTVRNAEASEQFSYILTRETRVSQSIFGRWNETDDNVDETSDDPMAEATISKAAEAGMTIGFDRSFRDDQISVEAGASVQRLERIAPATAAQGSRLDKQIQPRLRLQWRHDWSRRVATSLDGGVAFVYPFGRDPYNPGDERDSGIYPVIGGQVSLDERWGRASASLRRDITPNLFIAQNTVTDTASIAAVVPLNLLDVSRMRQPRLIALGSIGVTRTQLIDSTTSEAESTLGAGRLDLGVTYVPRPGFSYSVRYELAIQTGDDNAPVMPLEGFFRNTIYFTFAVRYPDRLSGEVPKNRRSAIRADGKDMLPIGGDPVIPDLIDGSGEGGGGDER